MQLGQHSCSCHNSGVSEAETKRISEGRHRDPFSFLGPHETNEGWVVRAWLPQAERVELVDAGMARPMRPDPAVRGFFSASLAAPPSNYRFRLTLYSGETETVDD